MHGKGRRKIESCHFTETGLGETNGLGVKGFGESDWHEQSNEGANRRVRPTRGLEIFDRLMRAVGGIVGR